MTNSMSERVLHTQTMQQAEIFFDKLINTKFFFRPNYMRTLKFKKKNTLSPSKNVRVKKSVFKVKCEMALKTC